MTIETSFNYPSDLNASYPGAADAKSEGDDHLRGLKTCFKTTFPNVSGAITPTHTVLNYMLGVTSAVQTQMDLKAPLASPTFTGTVVLPSTTSIGTVSATEIGYLDNVTSAIQTQLNSEVTNRTNADALKADLASPALTGTPTAPTASVGTGTTQIATTAFVAATSLVSALPGQTGNSGKTVTTDGTNASWVAVETLVPPATQANQETATSTATFVTPGRQQYHPSAAKCWLKCDAAGAIQVSYNVTSITDGGVGLLTVTIATDFSSADYAVVGTAVHTGSALAVHTDTPAGGSFNASARLGATNALADPTNWCLVAFGDQ